MSEEITRLMTDLEEKKVLKLVETKINEGVDINSILDACQAGMVGVGERFEAGTYYVSDLMMAGEIFKQISVLIEPLMTGGGSSAGKIVVGTVKDDIHDIGKDIVVSMLKSANFEVTDLGVDVPVEKFVSAVKETGAPVVALSALLTVAFDSLKGVVDALDEAGVRDKVKIMVGGGPVDANVCKYSGADDWADSAQGAVNLAKRWVA